MVVTTIPDYWLLPQHEQFVGEILDGIESIRAIPGNRRPERRQRTDQVSREIKAKVEGLSREGDAQFVSDLFTVISRLVEICIEGNRQYQEIWQDLMGDYRPGYPASPVEEEEILPGKDVLDGLPEGSWLISMRVKLERQFASKDDSDFHFSNNPIVRDHMTGLPIVRPTTWKGHLRFAARMVQGVMDKAQEPETMRRLFGETRGEEGGLEGRLRFFPTFFTANVQREVITPLRRATRTPARGPIDIEVAPAGAEGTFCLLYLPLPRGQGWSPAQIAEDLQAIAGALRTMFLEYGFSAKKTASWGLVEDTLSEGKQGYLWAKGEIWPQAGQQGGAGCQFQEPAPEWLPLMNTAGNPLPQLLNPDGSFLSNKEYGNLVEKLVSGNVYKQFRNWYSAHCKEWRRRRSGSTRDADAVREYSFPSVTSLETLLKELAEAWHREGANG